MPSYMIFRIDLDSRRRSPSEWLEADDDDEALESARSLADGTKCEVWLKTRLVGIVGAKSEAVCKK